jgi:hypothetical protein
MIYTVLCLPLLALLHIYRKVLTDFGANEMQRHVDGDKQ